MSRKKEENEAMPDEKRRSMTPFPATGRTKTRMAMSADTIGLLFPDGEGAEKPGDFRICERDICHAASTDVGNVSYACPTCYCELSTKAMGSAQIHNEEFLEVVKSPFAYGRSGPGSADG